MVPTPTRQSAVDPSPYPIFIEIHTACLKLKSHACMSTPAQELSCHAERSVPRQILRYGFFRLQDRRLKNQVHIARELLLVIILRILTLAFLGLGYSHWEFVNSSTLPPWALLSPHLKSSMVSGAYSPVGNGFSTDFKLKSRCTLDQVPCIISTSKKHSTASTGLREHSSHHGFGSQKRFVPCFPTICRQETNTKYAFAGDQ